MPCTSDRNLLFIHIPKTGGTSVEKALGLFGDWQLEDQSHLFGLIQSPQLLAHGWGSAFLQHLTWFEIQQEWNFDRALCFSVVRNPWARFASVYTNTDPHLVATARDQGVEVTGLDFPSFIAATEGLSHAHLRPQLDYLCDASRGLVVSHILRTENLNQDFDEFSRRHHLPTALPWENQSRVPRSLSELYNRATWQQIQQRYAEDIAMFGYQDVVCPV